MSETPPETCLCTALRQAARHLSAHYDAALAPTGVSVNQYAILARLDRAGSTTIQALAASLVMDRSTLGHLVRPLEARHLLEMTTGDADRRRRVLHLTEAGRALLTAARPLWSAAQNQVENAYGAPQSAALRADLRRLCLTEPNDVRHST